MDILAAVDVTDLRAEFPVLERVAYLNAGTDGPLAAAAVAAAQQELARELADGRAMAHFERRRELSDDLRAGLRESARLRARRRRADDLHDRRHRADDRRPRARTRR